MITIHVALYRSSFHGLRDTGQPDWPPSPRRILGALIAGAYALPDDLIRDRALEALRRLSCSSAPVIDAPRHAPLGLPPTYAPKTWLPDTTRAAAIGDNLDLSLFGVDTRSRTLKPQGGVALTDTTIAFHVDLICDEVDLAALDAAARHVPYFGTSRDPADLSVTRTQRLGDPPEPAQERWYPHSRSDGHTHGWQSNTFDWFEANFQRTFGRDPAVAQLPPIPPAGFVEQLAYRLEAPAIHVTFPIAQLTRSVPNNRIPGLIKQLSHELASLLSGWQVFPLTVSDEWADPKANGDGRCVGFGLTLTPVDADVLDARARATKWTQERAQAQQLLAKHVALLRVEADGLVVGRSAALNPVTWTGPADTWYSTTPLRAFPDERVVHYELSTQLNERYGVEVTELALQRGPRIRRNGRWSNSDLADGLNQWWAEITLSEQVEGPLLLGAATERGFGTFRPRSDT